MTIEMETPHKGDSNSRDAADDGRPRLLEQLLIEAARLDASHIHIDPGADSAEIAFRTAGLLHPFQRIPMTQANALASDIASLAALRADGAMPARGQLQWQGAAADVSMLPVPHGQRIVLRRPPAQSGHRGLETLGMSGALAHDVGGVLAGSGLLLVASPPEEGRSETLQALVRMAASRTRPALAIAPAPFPETPGVTLVETRDGAVAESIRAALDQDVEVVMIDSIGDRAVATAAAALAQAGRLVIAGIEAPNAVSALQQMRNWRIEAFQLASTLGMVLAQRLVQRLCGACREPVQASGSVSALLGFDTGAIVYAPTGCAVCNGTGFTGRTAVFESVRGDGTIRRLVNDGGDAAILARHAFVGTPDLGSAARALARTGVTTPDEAVRISRG